jgi:hypothetical protein
MEGDKSRADHSSWQDMRVTYSPPPPAGPAGCRGGVLRHRSGKMNHTRRPPPAGSCPGGHGWGVLQVDLFGCGGDEVSVTLVKTWVDVHNRVRLAQRASLAGRPVGIRLGDLALILRAVLAKYRSVLLCTRRERPAGEDRISTPKTLDAMGVRLESLPLPKEATENQFCKPVVVVS